MSTPKEPTAAAAPRRSLCDEALERDPLGIKAAKACVDAVSAMSLAATGKDRDALAAVIGIDRARLDAVLDGDGNVRVSTLARVLAACGNDLALLVTPQHSPAVEEPEHPGSSPCPHGPHRGPQGPNEDLSQCSRCWAPSWSLRPPGETIGLHAADCSLPERHERECVGGGHGHPPAKVVRGYWPGMEADIEAARARHADRDSTERNQR